jgi:hypothetical protein
MACMKTYVDKNGRELPGYFDYKSFVQELFVAWTLVEHMDMQNKQQTKILQKMLYKWMNCEKS